MGFVIPERKEVADFLQEVTSRKDQAQYRSGPASKEFLPVRDIVAAFNQTAAGKAQKDELATPVIPRQPIAVVVVPNACPPSAPMFFGLSAPYQVDPLVRSRFALGNKELFKALFHRDALLMMRNLFIYV